MKTKTKKQRPSTSRYQILNNQYYNHIYSRINKTNKTNKLNNNQKQNKVSSRQNNINNLELNILTYNICWGCMSANDKSQYDMTAQHLAIRCYKKYIKTGKNICAKNIINNILNSFKYNTNSKEIDILALQEATNWKLIWNALLNSGYDYLGYVHHNVKLPNGAIAEMVTIYNKDKFDIIAVKIGDLDLKNKGRPFQIIVLKHKQPKLPTKPKNKHLLGLAQHQYYVVINVHNGHNINQQSLTKTLNNNTDNQFYTGKFKNGNFDNKDLKSYKKINDFKLQPNAYIIFTGDTNDAGHYNLWDKTKQFRPIKGLPIVSNQSKLAPVKSCCIPTSKITKMRININNDKSYGDYILISDNLEYVNGYNNIIPTKNINHNATAFPASDHLPVLSIIKRT